MARVERTPRLGTKAFLSTLGDWSAGPGASLPRRLEGAIRQAIETGLLRPGALLPAERTMARSLGVSRSTVTHALNDLKADGYLEARHGSGTVVAGSVDPDRAPGAPMATVLPGLLGEWGGSIDLAASSPADARALPQVDVDLDSLLLSGPPHGDTPAGLPELRRAVAERFTTDGLATTAEQILITNGAQHALALAFSELTEPGDSIIVDEPTYPRRDRPSRRSAAPSRGVATDGGRHRSRCVHNALVRSSGARLAIPADARAQPDRAMRR
ncbi:MAG: aminotransferase class I/II-fold pyridoxal phosphate-dependent enzyme [Acidimicrobiales bacterium]